jgi:hypothetical protein
MKKSVMLLMTVMVFYGLAVGVKTGQTATTDKPKGNIYNETVGLGAASGAGSTKSEPSKSKLENDKPKGNIYKEDLKSVVVSDVKIEEKVIKHVEQVEKGVKIGLYLLLISLSLQVVALSSYRGKHKVILGLIVLVVLFYLFFHNSLFQNLINKLIGLTP